jgi:hypothetical protein
LFDPELFCPGKPGSAARGVRHQPKSVFGINRNARSASSEISVRLAPKWPFGFARPTHHTLPIGLCAALCDAMIGQYLQVVKGLHGYSLLEALTY